MNNGYRTIVGWCLALLAIGLLGLNSALRDFFAALAQAGVSILRWLAWLPTAELRWSSGREDNLLVLLILAAVAVAVLGGVFGRRH